MKRTKGAGLVLVAGGLAGLCAPVPAFAGDPAVTSVVEGRDAASGRPVVVLLGNDLTRAKTFALQSAADHTDAGSVQVLVRTKNLLVLALPDALPQGAYEIVLSHKKGTAKASLLLTLGSPLPGTVKEEALETSLKGDLADASTLDGRSPSYFTDATNLTTGTLHPSLYSAITDLTLEGRVGTASDQIARGDHEHDAAYFRKTELSDAGTVNASSNPVDWTKLKGVPAEIADGDANTTYAAGSGLTLSNGQFAASYGTTSSTVTRGDDIRLPPAPSRYGALLADTASNWVRLNPGAAGEILTMYNGVPTWLAGSWTVSGSDVSRSSGKVGIGTATPKANLHVAGNDGALFTGAFDAGTIPATGDGVRMMWYPKKGAFRAGAAFDGSWDDANIGVYSFASIYGAVAGDYSFAAGYLAAARGSNSVALGALTVAVGSGSFACGQGTTASGLISSASGRETVASGDNSFASGYLAQAKGDTSFASGYGTTASGFYSFTSGYSTTASGSHSFASGYSTAASGTASLAGGFFTTAQPFASVALGQFNKIEGTTTSWVSTEPVLVVGNGTSTSNRTNCFTLLKNGNLTISGTLTQNSDARLKTDIAPLAGVLPKLRAIRGVTYRFKDTDRNPADAQVGLLAQEVRAQFPELVSEDADGKLSIAYGNFNAVLVEAIREQEDEIARLTKELVAARDGFEKRLERLESQVAK